MPIRIGSRFIPRGSSDEIWTLTQPATSVVFQINVRSRVTGQAVAVNWGDGSVNAYTLSATANTAIAHTYASGAVYVIRITTGAQNIVYLTSVYTDGRADWGANISNWTSLTYLYVSGSNTLSGSVAALTSLTDLIVMGSNTLSGSVANLTNLTYLYVSGSNALSGSVAALTSLTVLRVQGGLNTIDWTTVGPLTKLTTLYAGDNALSQAQVDALLLAMYTARATYIGVSPAATLGGTNSAPSGTYADEDPPVTGKGMIYELVNDPETEGFTKWAITYTA